MATEKNFTTLNYNGYVFLVDLLKDKKFINDYNIVTGILDKGEKMTAIDRLQLLNVYSVSFHNDGKIEDTCSCDSSAHNCKFCLKMREAAEKDPTIICGLCYDWSQENYRRGVRNRHSLNLMIMATVEFTVEELAILPASAISRINSSGDTENEIHAKNMINFAYAHKYSRVAYWAKNKKAVISACDALGKPENLILVQSSIRINCPDALAKYFDYVFTVYVDKESTEKAIAGGACECNGKKCKDCGFKCYLGLWPKGANIAEHLRVDKKTRSTIMTAIENKRRNEGT